MIVQGQDPELLKCVAVMTIGAIIAFTGFCLLKDDLKKIKEHLLKK
jgi:hypothetical protein